MSNIPAARLAALEAVVEAARKVAYRTGDDWRPVPAHVQELADAVCALDAHTEAPQETVTLAMVVWQAHHGKGNGMVVFTPTHLALDEATRLGTTQITITPEDKR